MASSRWTWTSWLPYDTPQHFGDNPVFDWLRLGLLLSTIVLVYVVARVLREQRRRTTPFVPGQAARFVALGLGSLYIIPTELVVFGTVATPRLLVAVAFNVVGWYGLQQARRTQRATPVTRR